MSKSRDTFPKMSPYEEFLAKPVLEAKDWSDDALFLLDTVLSGMFYGKLTAGNLLTLSAEDIKRNAELYFENAEKDLDDEKIENGIKEIKAWLEDNFTSLKEEDATKPEPVKKVKYR